jgi:hypothetical protein
VEIQYIDHISITICLKSRHTFYSELAKGGGEGDKNGRSSEREKVKEKRERMAG